jgi:periplasmic divalent cation tolerance protein
MKVISVVTTTGSKEEAARIAEHLVEQRLAACVQIAGPITSMYRWQGKVEVAEEWQCWIKTREELYARVEAAIKASHSYEEPQVIALPVVAGSAGYLRWLEDETS